MYDSHTIVAQATPFGRGSVSIIRLSGEKALLIAQSLASDSIALRDRVVVLSSVFIDSKKKIDEALFTYFRNPNSYTGEDIVEISCHGNPVIVDSIIKRACFLGAKIAEPGEFTKRAFLNGKLDLIQAEAVGDLINSRSEEAALHQNKNLSGSVSSTVLKIQKDLLSILSSLEFEFDVSELDTHLPENVNNYLKVLKNSCLKVRSILNSYSMGLAYTQGLRIALVGKPNVGKSTLMNCLLGENRSITSSVSGTTRDTITSEITLSGVPALLIDTAGITNTNNPIEKEGVLRASKEIERADIIISMSSPKIKKIETKHSKKTIHVYNKTDSIKAGLVKKPSYFYISALNNQGVDLLLERLKLLVTENNFSTDSTINNLRQKDALEKSLSSLTSALNILKNNKPELELVAFEIKDSMNFLSVFLGKVNSEDVLNGVFSNFCVGK